jgi:predicted dehydrogenase
MDQEAKKVRWGILGTGRITHQFASDFEFVSNGEIQAVASRSQVSADNFAKQYSLSRSYSNYDELLDDPDIDAVYIATPHTMHFQNAADAIAAGKHVLCEKPFTVGESDSRRLFHLANQRSVFMMEAMWTYFLPAIRKAQDWVQLGHIGRVRQLKADFGYPQLPYSPDRREYNAELGGGCLLEMGIYPVAIAWLFLQQDPDDIQVICRKAPNGVEDDVQMLFNYGDNDSGCSATLATSFRSKLQNWAYIIGEEGYIAIPDFWRANECRLYELDDCVDHFRDGRKSLGLDYETVAANEDILAGRQQNRIMPWSNTLRFQEHMSRVKALF